MTDTNYTIPKKVFIFENDVTDGFIVLEIFPYDIIVRSQTNDPAEAKLRLAHFLRDEVGANAALETHFVGPDFVKESLSTGVISIPDKRRDYVESLMNKMIFENEGQDILSPAFIRTGLIELVLFIIRCRDRKSVV